MFDFYSQKTFSSHRRNKCTKVFPFVFFVLFRFSLISFFSFFIYCLLLLPTAYSQSAGIYGSTNLGVNTTGAKGNASSIFDISSTTKGILIPRVTLAQRTTPGVGLLDGSGNLPAAAQGLLVYQTDGTQGFYYNTSITTTPAWVLIAAGGASAPWTRSGTNVFLTNNASGDSVGIGTSSPTAKLHIVKTTSDVGDALYSTTTGTGRAGLFEINNAGNISTALEATTSGDGAAIYGYNNGSGWAGYFQNDNAAGTQPAVVATSNGIGDGIFGENTGTGKAGSFQILNAGSISDAVNITTNGTNSKVLNISHTGTAGVGINYGAYSLVNGARAAGSTNIAGYFSASGATNNYAAIFDQGNVGIGTTSPTSKLHITGSFGGGNITHIENTEGTTGGGLYIKSGSASAGDPLTVETGASSRFKVKASGRVGIGTGSPSHPVHIAASGTTGSDVFLDNTGLTNGTVLYVQSVSTTGTGGNSSNGIRIDRSGANANATHTAKGLDISVANTGTTNTNIAANLKASGASTANIALRMEGSTSGSVDVSPAAVTTSYALTMPAAQGAASTFLQNDGAGNLSWASASTTAWGLLGNTGTTDGTNFIGTTDDKPFNIRVFNNKAGRISSADNLFLGYLAGNNSSVNVKDNIAIGDSALFTQSFTTAFSSQNVAIGNSALFLNNPTTTTNGYQNTAIGNQALRNNTTGYFNTATGYQSLYSNNNGYANTASGYQALYNNTTGSSNTATGVGAMFANTTGSNNMASGYAALYSNSTATQNVAVGTEALYSQSFNTGGLPTDNVAVGWRALFSNQPTSTTNGYLNTAIGSMALTTNTNGAANVATGAAALYSNNTGSANVATGTSAMYTNSTGNSNVAVGHWALYQNSSGSTNVAIGREALFSNTASSNTALGFRAMYSNTNTSDNIAIGDSALYTQSFATAFSSENVAIGNSALFTSNPTSTVNGRWNTAIGGMAMRNNTTGSSNTAVGRQAMYSNSTGVGNAAFGAYAGWANTTGSISTAIGSEALYSNTTGGNNTALGHAALRSNTLISQNIAIGDSALYTQSFGSAFNAYNIAIGNSTLYANNPTTTNTGKWNTAVGHTAMRNITNGYYSTAVGYAALYSNATGFENTAVGVDALYTSTGNFNTAVGNEALVSATSASGNTAIGYYAGSAINSGSNNTLVGYNTALGSGALTNCIAIGGNGNLGIAASNTVRIGNASMSTGSIGGQVGWTTVSDARTKKDVRENVAGLSFIMALHPVTYIYDIEKENELMGICDMASYTGEKVLEEEIRFSGFLAQEVEAAAKKLNYDFSGVDKSQVKGGGLYGLRYAEFVVPLVKAVQELDKKTEDGRRKTEELEATIKSQQSAIRQLSDTVGSLQSAIKKLEISNLQQVTSNQQLLKEVEKIKEYLELSAKEGRTPSEKSKK